jgi:AcrR family transcriptional regulator
VLDAARAVLGESGPEASMEQIAARAGVGVGTVYRCFPSKDALIDELVRQVMDSLLTAGEAALVEDDGHGLERYLFVLGEMLTEHRRYAGLILARGSESTARQVRAHLVKFTETAIRTGTLDAAVTVGDVMTLVWSLRAVIETTGGIAPHAWRRYLDIHLGGLRGPSGSQWSKPITDRQLAQLAPR